MNSSCSLDACGLRCSEPPLILAIDDDDDNLFLLSYIIEALGLRFVGQPNSKAAVTSVKIYQPALILLDVLMPDIDGIQLLQLFRREPSVHQTPIIAVTAMAQAEDRRNLLQLGFTDYISKPYILDDLEILIRWHLQQTYKTANKTAN